MKQIFEVIRKKPLFFVVSAFVYLIIVVFLKWQIHPTFATLWFSIGGIIGIYFLDIAESFLRLSPSPFRTIVFTAGFVLVSFFVVTSSGSALAAGLVVSLYLNLLFWQIGEWRIVHNVDSWYRMVAGPVRRETQQWILVGFIIFFLIETYVFIR